MAKSTQRKEIRIQYGSRILTIAPVNPDSLRAQESTQTLIRTMQKHDIDIARNRETHNGGIGSQQYDKCIIY